MSMMKYAEDMPGDKEDHCVAWLTDGKSFVIRNPDGFTRRVLPKFFKATKFSSFTRKLYRWGFRQVNRGIGPDDPIIFGNEFFQRDRAELMVKMRSVTAAGIRKAQSLEAAQAQIEAVQQHRNGSSNHHNIGGGGSIGIGSKRTLDFLSGMTGADVGSDPRKRLFLELQQQQHQNFMQEQQFNLANALRAQSGLMGGKPNGMQGFPQAFSQAAAAAMNPLQLYLPQAQQAAAMQQQQQQMQQSFGLQLQQQQQQQQQQNQGFGNNDNSNNNNNNGSTADIVNAAINALRYSS